ncbi:MAG TPA: hypothetical protein VGZ73_24645 [Bryobacteraceae bacterium]|nr:hypothetical protein [Bryobacteraceae bacterium]
MNPKNRALLLIAILAALCGGSIWGVALYRARYISTGMLLNRMPTQDAVIFSIDFSALRRGGILQLLEGSRASEDPDYQNFARKINFDYREDLDSVLATFTPSARYFLIRGRFTWKSLRSYAMESGGNCLTALCRMTGSTPDRRISFFPVQSGLMALAVSTYESAVLELTKSPSGPPAEVPDAPVWLSVPGALLRSGHYLQDLPEGTKMFTRGMDRAEKVVLTFAPEGNRLAAGLEIRCRNEQDAVEVASQLSSATLTLRQMIEREHQTPGSANLAGVLVAGSFRTEGRTVFGRWPVERAFIETILGGGLS